MKLFDIYGPISPAKHYFLPRRLDWKKLSDFIEKEYYFVLHAPRQSGKTTAVEEFVDYLNTQNKYAALYINIEAAQAARDNIEQALIAIVDLLTKKIAKSFKEQKAVVEELEKMLGLKERITINLLFNALTTWAELSPKPIALFIDEIDSLIGDSLLSVLRQLRAGYNEKPRHFPQSVCLIGLRDVRDYRVWSRSQGAHVSTSSPFNIKAESITLANFTDKIYMASEFHFS